MVKHHLRKKLLGKKLQRKRKLLLERKQQLRSNSLKREIGSLDSGANPDTSTKSTFKIRNCITCGKEFKVIIDHPTVVHCSKECVVDGGELGSTSD